MHNEETIPCHPQPHSDRMARLVLDSATDFAIISIDLSGAIMSWNAGAEHVLGWSEAEILGKPACTFFTDEDQAEGICEREMAIAAHTGRAEDERWHQRKDGSRLWASGLMMRFDAEDSDEQIGYIKILRDRTAQHVGEQRFRASQAQLSTALTAGKLGIWQVDLPAMALSCDEVCKANHGHRPETAISYDELIATIHADDRPGVVTGVRRCLDTGDPYDADYRVVWPDGSKHWLHTRGTVHWADDGKPVSIGGVVADITDRKRTEAVLERHALELEDAVDQRTAALADANEQLRREINERQQAEETLRQAQKMEAVGQLTGGVAHDFNNLLTIIRGSVDLLMRPGISAEKRERHLGAISQTVDRATTLTGQLLAFARRQPLKPQVFELGERFAGMADMLLSTIGAKVEMSVGIAPDTWPVLADPAQFDTAMLNLTVNARDAMPNGGSLSFAVHNVEGIPARRGHDAAHGQFVAIEVRDTGSGIPDALIDRIYEPFFTTKGVGKGTGLGLSQVIGFAKQSGGDIVTESAPKEGSRFTLYLPRSQEAAVVEELAQADDTESQHGQGCILVVEDNVQVGEFATQMLHELGYSTTWATSGHMALELVTAHPERFDAVFSDVVMPGMNGIELAQRLRQDHPLLPVILASGYSQVIAQEGSHGFELLQKPYSVEKLSKVLARALLNASSRSGTSESG